MIFLLRARDCSRILSLMRRVFKGRNDASSASRFAIHSRLSLLCAIMELIASYEMEVRAKSKRRERLSRHRELAVRIKAER